MLGRYTPCPFGKGVEKVVMNTARKGAQRQTAAAFGLRVAVFLSDATCRVAMWRNSHVSDDTDRANLAAHRPFTER
jgi:hypothetical protein